MRYPQFITDLMDETLTDFPDVPTRTLAKRIYNDHKKFFKDLEQVRSALRRRRGNSGKGRTMNSDHKRKNGKAGWVPKLPPSQSKGWEPHVIKGPERIAVISDIHLPYHCEKTLNKWYAEAQEYEPSMIIINGDLLDFYRMSRFEKNPNMRDTSFEIDQAHEFFDWLTASFQADIIFKEGNHDERWRKYMFNQAPELSRFKKFELQEILELDEFGVTFITDQRMILAGDLPILHGHEFHGAGGQNPAGAVARKLGNSGLMGHCHRTSQHSVRTTMGKWIKAYSTGCMCELSPEFSRINNWNNGYAFVEIDSSGAFEVDNRVVN